MPNQSTEDRRSDELRAVLADADPNPDEPKPTERLGALERKTRDLREKADDARATLEALEGEDAPAAGKMKRLKNQRLAKRKKRNRKRRERKGQRRRKKDDAEAGGISFEEAFAKINAAGKHPIENRRSAARTFANAGVSAEHVDAVLESMNSPQEATAQRRREARAERRKNQMLAAVGEGSGGAEDGTEGEEGHADGSMLSRGAATMLANRYATINDPDVLFRDSARSGPRRMFISADEYERVKANLEAKRGGRR